MRVTQAVILAGGEGTRLRPLTNSLSKLAVPLVNEPLISYNLRHMARHGITRVIITLCYLPETVRDAIGDGGECGLNVEYVVEEEPLGTGGALRNVQGELADRFFAINGDDLMDVDYTAMAEAHEEAGATASIALYRVPDPSQYGLVRQDDSGRVTAFLEKESRPPPGTNTINAGAYLLTRDALANVPAGKQCSMEYDVFPRLIGDGRRVQAFVHEGYWIDVGRPDAYLQAHWDLMGGKGGSFQAPPEDREQTHIHPSARVKAPTHIGANVAVDREAAIGPNVCIGGNCRIGAGAQLDGCVVWEDVVIGAGAGLHGSIICSGVRIADGVAVGPGSIIAAGSTLM